MVAGATEASVGGNRTEGALLSTRRARSVPDAGRSMTETARPTAPGTWSFPSGNTSATQSPSGLHMLVVGGSGGQLWKQGKVYVFGAPYGLKPADAPRWTRKKYPTTKTITASGGTGTDDVGSVICQERDSWADAAHQRDRQPFNHGRLPMGHHGNGERSTVDRRSVIRCT